MTSSKQYHWHAQQKKRDAKGERLTAAFKAQEEADRNAYQRMPSPKGANTWWAYIKHHIDMLPDGIAAYTTKAYTRLALDKYIASHRAIDTITGKLVKGQPAIIYMGAAQVS